MNKEESIQQIETLIEAWQLDEADLNQTDINAMQALLKENKELKEKYENAVADYETTMFEKEQLKKQLKPNYYVKGLEGTLKEYQQEMNKVTIQQKEFIKWLENGIEKVKNTEFLDERIQRAGLIAYNRCLQKYKKIIGDK